MDREIQPVTDPNIQAFSIIDERLSNLEDDMLLLKDSMKWTEMRRSGRLNNRLLGYPFNVEFITCEEDPIGLQAAVIQVFLDCNDSCSANKNGLPSPGKVDKTCNPPFARRFILGHDNGYLVFGLIALNTHDFNVCDALNEVLLMLRGQEHRLRCTVSTRVYTCDAENLAFFASGVRVEQGTDSETDKDYIMLLKKHHIADLKSHEWFANQLHFMPKFQSLLSTS